MLGGKDLGRTDDYMTEEMPPVNNGLLNGDLAWRQHDGGHTDTPNIPHFTGWAELRLGSMDELSQTAESKGKDN